MNSDTNLQGYPVDGLEPKRRLWAVMSAMLALAMAVLDINIVNVVLPHMAGVWDVSDSMVIWVITIYQLAIVTMLLPFSFLGDKFGYNRVFLFGISVFLIGSIVCVSAQSFEMLLVGRFIQGLGASAQTGVNQAQLRTLYPARLIGRALALNATVVAISSAIGPTLAGVLLSLGSWRWLFAINLPLGLLSITLGLIFLPRISKARPMPIDLLSVVLNVLTFGLLFYALDYYSRGGRIFVAVTLLFHSYIFGSIYVRREKKKNVPMLPIDLIKIPLFSRSLFTSFCSFVASMALLVSLPFFFHNMLGYTPFETGLMITPWPVATIIVAPISGRLVCSVHPGILGAIGMALFSVGCGLLWALLYHPSTWLGIVALVLCGAGFGMFQTPNNTTIMTCAPKARSGGSSGMIGVARLTGQTLGASAVALVFALQSDSTLLSTQTSTIIALLFALTASILSISRIKMKTAIK